jgi:hypothetical protein
MQAAEADYIQQPRDLPKMKEETRNTKLREEGKKTKNEHLIYRRIMSQQLLLRTLPVVTAASSPCLRRRAW